MPLPAETAAVSYFAGGGFACALLRSGRVTCWGRLHVNPLDLDPQTPFPGVDMGLSGMRYLTANATAACASQGPGGGTWCWGNVASLLDRDESDTPRGVGFSPPASTASTTSPPWRSRRGSLAVRKRSWGGRLRERE